jgi:hypothetical protein
MHGLIWFYGYYVTNFTINIRILYFFVVKAGVSKGLFFQIGKYRILVGYTALVCFRQKNNNKFHISIMLD